MLTGKRGFLVVKRGRSWYNIISTNRDLLIYSNWDLYNRTIEGVNVLERLEDEINLKNNNPKEIKEETKTSTVAPTTYPTPIKRDVSKLVLSPNQNESK